MQAITIFCSLLFASANAWHHRDSTESNAIHNFGIYGGSPINITKVPYMALLRNMKFGGRCGAVIVSDQFLLTSTFECTTLLNTKSYYKVTVGTDVYTDGEDYDIDRIYIRPHDNDTYNDDIALIKLKKKLKFSDRVQTIKMADSNLIPKQGDIMETLGFGFKNSDEESNILLSVKLPFVDHEKCKQMYQDYIFQLSDIMICAGGENGKGGCWFDEGGPLTYKGQLIGIFMRGCAVQGLPSVFYYVPALRDYIDLVLKSNP